MLNGNVAAVITTKTYRRIICAWDSYWLLCHFMNLFPDVYHDKKHSNFIHSPTLTF
jgi:hypothetical protein